MTRSRDPARSAFDRRVGPGEALAGDAERVAEACHAMAVRFHRGGTLIVFGNGGGATDAAHIAVEFVHPVIVGKRALPSLSLANDTAAVTGAGDKEAFDDAFAAQLRLLGGPHDIALGVSTDGNCHNVLRALKVGMEMGMLTVALVGGNGGQIGASDAVDHLLVAHSDDASIVKEIHVTTYHVLWELVHVFFEQPGLFAPGVIR